MLERTCTLLLLSVAACGARSTPEPSGRVTVRMANDGEHFDDAAASSGSGPGKPRPIHAYFTGPGDTNRQVEDDVTIEVDPRASVGTLDITTREDDWGAGHYHVLESATGIELVVESRRGQTQVHKLRREVYLQIGTLLNGST